MARAERELAQYELLFTSLLCYASNMSLPISEDKPKITKFLTTNNMCVFAWSYIKNQPHAATIYFLFDPFLNI
jgi:hypothetical protein